MLDEAHDTVKYVTRKQTVNGLFGGVRTSLKLRGGTLAGRVAQRFGSNATMLGSVITNRDAFAGHVVLPDFPTDAEGKVNLCGACVCVCVRYLFF
jgi:hypothetical protein